jgi:hypothetical protein
MPYITQCTQEPRFIPCNEPDARLIAARTSSDTDPNFFNVSQVVFASASVIIGLLALIIGVLQLRKYRRRHLLQNREPIFELEAYIPMVG